MSNKRMVPEVRFKGFEQSWNKSKIKDCISKGASGNTPNTKNKTFYEGNIPFLNISDITSNSCLIYDTEKHITYEAVNSCTWIVPKNSISLAMYASVGKVCMLMNDMATSQAMFNMIFKENHSPYFMLQNFELTNNNDKWCELISTGTQPNLNAEKIQNFELHYPTYQEQYKIGEFFKNIDNLITQTNNKLDKLKDVKKSLLNKMFPIEGKHVPEIRFKGFDDNWKKDNIKNLFLSLKTGLSFSQNIYDYRKYIIMDMGSVDTSGQIIDTKKTNLSRDILLKGDLIMPKDDIGGGLIIGKTTHIPENNKYVLGDHVYLLRSKQINSLFAHHYIHSSTFNESIKTQTTGTAQIGLRKEVVENEKILFSTNIPEQSKIAEFLTAVDKLITLTNKKLTKLKEIKKALLQKMFV
ncbi:restriction endonuclease subunit S [Mycoplasmopsis felifaucium]|uniref:Restriction endonuclease subunit S n=1 Tax=Mycoplasmopsis felifaucium TaxID=35768 RepID=A0ABZ2RS70_9BACT